MAEIDRDKIFDELLSGGDVVGWQGERYIGTDILICLYPRTVWARQNTPDRRYGRWVELPKVA